MLVRRMAINGLPDLSPIMSCPNRWARPWSYEYLHPANTFPKTSTKFEFVLTAGTHRGDFYEATALEVPWAERVCNPADVATDLPGLVSGSLSLLTRIAAEQHLAFVGEPDGTHRGTVVHTWRLDLNSSNISLTTSYSTVYIRKVNRSGMKLSTDFPGGNTAAEGLLCLCS